MLRYYAKYKIELDGSTWSTHGFKAMSRAFFQFNLKPNLENIWLLGTFGILTILQIQPLAEDIDWSSVASLWNVIKY